MNVPHLEQPADVFVRVFVAGEADAAGGGVHPWQFATADDGDVLEADRDRRAGVVHLGRRDVDAATLIA